MNNSSRLHFPKPYARPGEKPDFSRMQLSDAGVVEKPPVQADPGDIEYLSRQMVRVLDPEGTAVGPWTPKIEPERLIAALRHMQLSRAIDKRMWQSHRQGGITFYMQSVGEEAVSVGQGLALHPNDMCFPSYRNLGLFLLRGTRIEDIMCQCLSNTGDMCKGRQMPVMYHNRKANIFSISGNLATQYPQAVGWAMAAAIKGETSIAATWIGDGATAEGDFHYALTFASVYQVPVVLNVVNNQWAISTPQAVAGGERRPFAARGASFGIPGIRVDGNDLLAVYSVSKWAVDRARGGLGPTLIELVTYRGGAHSSSDDPSKYRPKEEWSCFPLGDPIDRLASHLMAIGVWSSGDHDQLVQEVKSEVSVAWKDAQKLGTLNDGPQLDPATMFDDVYERIPQHLVEQRNQLLKLGV
jgi:2-oxoisovalerate dehydrogenase E1 component alpha subunit